MTEMHDDAEERPKRPKVGDGATALEWAAFLRARTAEERRRSESAALALDGVEAPWWELTDAGAERFGVEAGGRVIAPIFTGRGHWADHEVALHIVRNQPGRSLDDLDAKDALADLLDHCDNHGEPLSSELALVVRKFAAPFIDHPDHPEYEPPEET
ncbi:DUF6221 family protein [Streptomyces sp. NPDC053427]|uniref:DUF6221 family protein n=1 Tax=Streptomyces sp. NPDC053427 TaxID=3365701 RepID=UPI0037D6AFA7